VRLAGSGSGSGSGSGINGDAAVAVPELIASGGGGGWGRAACAHAALGGERGCGQATSGLRASRVELTLFDALQTRTSMLLCETVVRKLVACTARGLVSRETASLVECYQYVVIRLPYDRCSQSFYSVAGRAGARGGVSCCQA
jgi:hypothetical protein